MADSGNQWKAPVIHLNDSQVALVSVYRKIMLDQEKSLKQKDPSYKVDEFLKHAVMAFTTHTYNNRKEYRLENGTGDRTLASMDIPFKYRKLFKRLSWWGGRDYAYDMASGALRTSDWQGAVARAHRNDVAPADEWITKQAGWNKEASQLVDEFDVDVNLIGVSNGDHREKSAVVFRDILRELYGEDVDVENLTGEQVESVKRQAKKQLRLGKNQVYYSTRKSDDGSILNPDQMVVSYSGRLVPEKVSSERLFDKETIKILLRNGVQVAIWGNQQSNNPTSDMLADYFIELIEELEGNEEYTGRLIFVPRFSLADQRALLAATDVQAQLSKPMSEAAGYTEADVSACGGIQFPPSRKDNGIGEGLLEAQGLPLNFDNPGEGNTITADEDTIESYRNVLLKTVNLYNKGLLKAYQAESIKLSRVLEAILTAAEYLRQFSNAVAKKESKEKEEIAREEFEKMQIHEQSLFEKVFTPDQLKDPREHFVYISTREILRGNIDEAVNAFFTSAFYQNDKSRMETIRRILNSLLDLNELEDYNREYVAEFARSVISRVTDLSEYRGDGVSASKDIQLMAGQVLTILSWMDRGIVGAESIGITVDEKHMLKNDKRGKSFIDIRTLPDSLSVVVEEGDLGIYWRGTEGIKKLGKNVKEGFIVDEDAFTLAEKDFVQYLMDHGFVSAPDGLKKATTEKRLSTIHETFFCA